jgi:DNA-binding LacI/PurR family transcriptional regulator
MPDYPKASEIALEHLVGLGHQRLALISGPFGTSEPAILEFNRGVRLGLEKLNVPLETQHVVYGDLNFAAGITAADTLLDRKPVPTAIYCLSDAVAAGVIARAQARGLKIPEQLSVVGCGGDPVGELTLPGLTTVQLPFEEMASRGLFEVDKLTRFDGLPEAQTITLPVKLIQRGSSGPVPKN